jgi:ubiquitin-protein ligase
VTQDFPQTPPVCKFRTKIYHPQVSSDGIGKFWLSTKSQSMRDLLQSIRQQLLDISTNEGMHVQLDISFEFLNDRSYFEEIARQQTKDYAVDRTERESGIYI